MSDPIHDLSHATHGLTAQQRLDGMLAQIGRLEAASLQAGAERGPAAPTHSLLVESTRRINEVMRSYAIEFHLYEYDGRTITRVVDRDSGETIRQIPSEELLRIADSLDLIQGRLIQLEA